MGPEVLRCLYIQDQERSQITNSLKPPNQHERRSQLTEKGRSQARETGAWLATAAKQHGFDRVLMSPKDRTMQTLDEIEGELNKVTRGCDKVTPYLFFTAKTSKTC